MAAGDTLFRFERLNVWQRAADVTVPLGRVADRLAERHLYRYAEQLRAAALSISNNIARAQAAIPITTFAVFLT